MLKKMTSPGPKIYPVTRLFKQIKDTLRKIAPVVKPIKEQPKPAEPIEPIIEEDDDDLPF